MLIKNVNGSSDQFEKTAYIVSTPGMDKIRLNTAAQPPSDVAAGRLEESDLQAICGLFGPR